MGTVGGYAQAWVVSYSRTAVVNLRYDRSRSSERFVLFMKQVVCRTQVVRTIVVDQAALMFVVCANRIGLYDSLTPVVEFTLGLRQLYELRVYVRRAA